MIPKLKQINACKLYVQMKESDPISAVKYIDMELYTKESVDARENYFKDMLIKIRDTLLDTKQAKIVDNALTKLSNEVTNNDKRKNS